MSREIAADTLRQDLHRLFEAIRNDLDRVEILAVTLDAFQRPVPDYEPRFHHLKHEIVDAQELRR